ncbi:MAG: GNAT family N-acetyltransferase [Nitrospinae bacterium]|nr:GNAT family N-acetyltransferase [Nitrospinota bacterium]
MEIRKLEPSDDRSGFSCGDGDLDRFFRKYAGQNQWRHYLGSTYIATRDGVILGFVTVSVGELTTDKIAIAIRKKLPSYPIPVFRIARLGVALRYQRQGVGSALLRAMLLAAVDLHEKIACAGVVVDAKPEAAAFYEKLGFAPLNLQSGWLGDRPQPASLFLPIGTIIQAIKG